MSSENQVQEVKQKLDIVEVVGERVDLKRAGRNFKGLCPFHGEKTPSFFVSPEMQMYKCFGCSEAGDVISFVEKFEGLTFPEALEILAKKAGVTLDRSYHSEGDARRERLLELLHLAAEYYHYLLTEHRVGEKARAYLTNRGIYKESWRTFQLGYAPDSWRGVSTYLSKKKKFTNEELIAVGLTINSDRVGSSYDRFRGRVMFPQKTIQGKVVGFAGRLLDPKIKEAKYVNSPETKLYHKGDILYGLSVARREIRQTDRAIVVEGELDVISSHQVGVKEVVAVKGSALTEGQLLLLTRLTHNITLALDADTAGQEAITRAIQLAEPTGVNLRVAQLLGGKDPDEMAQKEAAGWKLAVVKAVSVYQFYQDLAFKRFDAHTGLGQKQITQMVVPQLKKIENAVEQAYYVKQLADRLGVGEAVVEREMARVRADVGRKDSTPRTTEKASSIRGMVRRERLERMVIASSLHLEMGVSRAIQTLQIEWFAEDYLRRLVEQLQTIIKDNPKLELAQVTAQLPEAQQQLVQELYTAEENLLTVSVTEGERLWQQTINDLEKTATQTRLKTVVKEMATAEAGSADLVKLTTEQRRLSQELKTLDE